MKLYASTTSYGTPCLIEEKNYIKSIVFVGKIGQSFMDMVRDSRDIDKEYRDFSHLIADTINLEEHGLSLK